MFDVPKEKTIFQKLDARFVLIVRRFGSFQKINYVIFNETKTSKTPKREIRNCYKFFVSRRKQPGNMDGHVVYS